MREIKNAVITDYSLGYQDHGIFTMYITVNYGGGAYQGFGGYALDEYVKSLDKRIGTKGGMNFMIEVMECVGVDDIKKLIGKHVRVDAESTKIHGIGNILKDIWFYPESFFKKEDVRIITICTPANVDNDRVQRAGFGERYSEGWNQYHKRTVSNLEEFTDVLESFLGLETEVVISYTDVEGCDYYIDSQRSRI
jgi:hypothetical protein